MNTLLLVDFDGTMFDTDILKDELKIFTKKYYGVEPEDYERTYEPSRHRNKAYNLFIHLKILGVKVDKKQIKKDFKEFCTKVDFSFKDFTDFYNKFLNSNNIDFVIYTNGYKEFQNLKLSVLNLKNKPKMIATLSGKKNLLKKYLTKKGSKVLFKGKTYDKVIYVEDREEYFDENLKFIENYLIDRNHEKKESSFYKIIYSFDELWMQINKFQL